MAAGAAGEYGVRVTGILVEPDYASLDQIRGLADAGKLRPILGERFPEQASKAHETGEAGRNLGKTVLVV